MTTTGAERFTACPKCGVDTGEKCRTPTGHKTKRMHEARVAAIQEEIDRLVTEFETESGIRLLSSTEGSCNRFDTCRGVIEVVVGNDVMVELVR